MYLYILQSSGIILYVSFYSAVIGAVCALFVVIAVNASLMTPRIVQSIANIPLQVFLHLFVILVG